ncbi:MAG: hypothetical protein IKV88_09665 [Clostridia bacterium]|nr:hypothetical protein [Clostridia bacterium]
MKARKLLALALSLVMIVTTIPSLVLGAGASDITLYPDNGKTFYAGSTMDFVATVANATNVTFALDGEDMGTPSANGTKYTLKYDVTALANGYHTFTVNATIGGQKVTNSSTFDFYGYEKVLMYNDFEGISDAPNSADLSQADNVIPGLVTYAWNNNSPSVAKTTGADGVGSAVRITTPENSGGYPYFKINLKNVPFAGSTLGNATGHKNGTFKTEFDLKVNKPMYIAALGVGSSEYGSTATSKSAPWICIPNGGVTNSSGTKHDGTWKHYEMIVDYNNNCLTTLVDGVVSFSSTSASDIFPYGVKDGDGIMFQAYGGDGQSADFEIDNLKITHSTAIEMGTINFNGMGDNVKQYDNYSYPRGYIVADSIGSSTFAAMQGPAGAGDTALKFTPSGNDYTNIRHYMQNRRYGTGITDGILKFSVDLYPTANFEHDLGHSYGFGGWTPYIWSGSCGSQPVIANQWNHIEYIADMEADTSRVYVNGVLAKTDLRPTGTILDSEQKFQYLLRGATNNTDGYVGFDNWSVTYINQPKVTQVSAKNAQGSFAPVADGVVPFDTTAFKLGLSKAYLAINASDVSVKVNGKEVAVASVSQDSKDVTISLASNVGSNKNIEITVKDTAVVGTSTSNGALDTVSTQARDAVINLKSTEDPALKPWKAEWNEDLVVFNDFETITSISENTTSAANMVTASTGDTASVKWTTNNKMSMQKTTSHDGSQAVRFYVQEGQSTGGYPEAHLSLNWLYNPSNPDSLSGDALTAGGAGIKSDKWLMEFDVKFDCDSTTLALLGTGSAGSSGIATSSGDNRILNTNNTIGSRNLAFTKGEWGKISVFSDFDEGVIRYYYNGNEFNNVAATQGFGNKNVFSRCGIDFQAVGGTVDFTIDNFKITKIDAENVHDLGTIDFEGLTDGATEVGVKSLLAPTVYKSINGIGFSNGLSASIVKAVEGPDGKGDTAFSFAPVQEHSGLRVYHLSHPFRHTRLGELNTSFDIKFTGDNLRLGISGGFGETWGDNQFNPTNCPEGSWHHVDVISDFADNERVIYIDGTEVSRGTLSSNFLSSYVGNNLDSNFLEFQARGYNSSKPDSSIAIDNISYHYIVKPGFGHFTLSENASDNTATATMSSYFTDEATYHEVIVASYVTLADGSLELDKVDLVPCDGKAGEINRISAKISEMATNKTIKAFVWGADQKPIEIIVK